MKLAILIAIPILTVAIFGIIPVMFDIHNEKKREEQNANSRTSKKDD